MRESGPHYVPGGTWAICDVCGFRYRLTELRKRWDGVMACREDWDPKPETMLPPRIIPGEGRPVRNARPEPADTFITERVTPEDL